MRRAVLAGAADRGCHIDELRTEACIITKQPLAPAFHSKPEKRGPEPRDTVYPNVRERLTGFPDP
jgi:hypothetical protein